MALPRDTTGLSAVFDCGISLSYSLTIATKICRELSCHGLGKQIKGYLHLCPRMAFLKALYINYSIYSNFETFLLNSIVKNRAQEATLTYSHIKTIHVSKILYPKSIVLFNSKICQLE